MNIGILTHPLETNYGGILQNYALQQTLISLGHNPITINCHPRDIKQLLKYNLKNLLFLPFSKKRRPFKWNSYIHPLFKSFISNINLTEYCSSISLKALSCYNLDAFIVGSDQVWRPKYVTNLDDMFLKFAQKGTFYKMAYAASFGTSQWEFSPKQTKRYRKLAAKFNKISVREYSGVALCKTHFNLDAQKVLDPTLLLNREQYERVISNIPQSESPYILAYILDNTPECNNLIKELAQEKNTEIKIVSAHDNVSITVEQWLSLFRDASYVITDSFHGTVFSIIFHKDFTTFTNQSRGADRFTSLLSGLSLNNRIWNGDINIARHTIDWEAVDLKLLDEREKSLSFLKLIDL